MSESIRIVVTEPTHAAEARRSAVRMANEAGFNEVRAGEVAIVVTEACTNILKHAGSGEILLRFAEEGTSNGTELEILSLDRGPGMASIDRCLQDGYSTAGSPGQGLGAIRRLADESDFYSLAGSGTAILARWHSGVKEKSPVHAHPGLRVGAVNVSKHGQEVCGDSWGMEQLGAVATIVLADGLGHGFEASQASREAVQTLRRNREASPKTLIELSHRALRSLRGAAVAVACVDQERGTLNFAGLGNIMAQIYDGSRHSQHLVSVNGTAGQLTPRIREFNYKWPEQGILVLNSDGLGTSTSLQVYPGLALCDPSLIAGVLYRDFSRGHDDATVVVAKAA
ncbi:MAG TPA: ATP-binding SpoIIE family protein phosphatase [Bryobacteraceae bacterium]|jgi:anti-sigma regulatory factor (Ser/Thr protein kinase)|nr:ATP-binding SpoIIE family protein phosphatase [Bryobacteraceae bacterium]